MLDDEIDDIIPATFWLEHGQCWHILSLKVHRKNPDLIAKPSDAVRGVNRKEQRDRKANRISQAREEAAREREEAISIRTAIQKKKLNIDEAMAKESIKSSKKKRETATIDNANKKLKALHKAKKLFIKKHSLEEWEKRVDECMMEMLDVQDEDSDKDCNSVNEENDGDKSADDSSDQESVESVEE